MPRILAAGGCKRVRGARSCWSVLLREMDWPTFRRALSLCVENMPPTAALSEAAYVDVMAYVLQVLKHPAGNTDLTADSPAMKRGIEAPR